MIPVRIQVAMLIVVCLLCGVFFFLGTASGQETVDSSSQVEKLEIVNRDAFQQVAEARGWNVSSSVLSSLSITYVTQNESGKILAINALTVRDPFDNYRTLVLTNSPPRNRP